MQQSGLLNAREIAELAMERWVVPRSQRRPEFRAWTGDDLQHLLTSHATISQVRHNARGLDPAVVHLSS